jgi:hypothetical protein
MPKNILTKNQQKPEITHEKPVTNMDQRQQTKTNKKE